jgi:dolichol-phosphate mannosyltransferase
MRQLTIVIPTYNEAENLADLFNQLFALPLPGLNLLIVDDGSPDGTGALAERLSADYGGRVDVLHRAAKMGLGSAYITGFKHALATGAEAIGQMDADFSHSPTYVPGFVEQLDTADAVFGSRYVPGGSLDERWGIGRVWLSGFGNFYARTILGMKTRDVTGGFRVWRRETLSAMPLDDIRSNGYVFQVEMAYVALGLGFSAVEMPIHFEDRRIGQSKMSMRIQIEAAFRVWQVLFLHRKLSPSSRENA